MSLETLRDDWMSNPPFRVTYELALSYFVIKVCDENADVASS